MFRSISSFFQKTVLISSLKNLHKKEKHHFQTVTVSAFHFKVASKPLLKMVPLAKFKFNPIWTLCHTFLENDFNFVTQIIAKNWNRLYSNTGHFDFHKTKKNPPKNEIFELSEDSFFTSRTFQESFEGFS